MDNKVLTQGRGRGPGRGCTLYVYDHWQRGVKQDC